MLQILKTSTKNIFSKRLIKNTAQQLTTNLDKPKLTERIEMTQKVTPYEVECSMKKIDYDSIVEEFGCNRIDQKMLERFERLTGKKPHPFMRRGLYFSHRDFDKILDSYEKKEPFYIFTGRGPSEGDMHIGHMIPFIFTQYIQSIFDCPLVIQINDDEKLFFKNVELDT
ncbi:tryptophan--tRNA ligase, partial [Bonamia ostreae]